MQKIISKSSISIRFLILAILATVVSVTFSVVNVNAAPSSNSEKNYIVVLKDNATDSTAVAKDHTKRRNAKVSNVYRAAIKGYSARMTTAAAQDLAKDPNVAFVEEDKVVTINAAQKSAPWGLDRIDQRSKVLNKTFNYTSTGLGVKAYIIDTGIRASHTDLSGRVLGGYDSVDGSLPANDCNGHGTHVAGTVGGTTYGVAKKVQLVPVRVLDCSGSGLWSQVIAGIDFVTADHQAGQPAVANMSLSGGASDAVDIAVKNSIADGVSYVIAAGNNSNDACLNSPARVSEAMTIGATETTDSKASYSNYGSCVDWYAPGSSIKSAWYTSNIATNTISGTSMASPHVAGVSVLYLQRYPQATPQQVRDALYNLTTKSVVTNAKSTTNNHLLFTNL